MRQIIKINQKSVLPKYQQIIDSLFQAVEKGILKKGDKLPSINQIRSDFNISRDTVLYAYNELKTKGILVSLPGKGYYLATNDTHRDKKIFILFDELNSFRKEVYNSLVNSLQGSVRIEVQFYNFNLKVFKNHLKECAGRYTSYIIMPGNFENTAHLYSKLPPDRVFLLDRLNAELHNYRAVYQDYEADFYEALVKGLPLLKKYMRLIFVYRKDNDPVERTYAFERFCKEHKFKYQIFDSITSHRPELYEVWFISSDYDLVEFLKITRNYKLKPGKKFGVVSFNDTLLKEVISGGITTISTDYSEMGKNLATMLTTPNEQQIRNPSKLIVRKSL